MKERISVSDCMVALPGAGRRTLLTLLSRELCLPASQQLCLLDASRLEDPEQLDLLRTAAEQRAQRNIVILNQSELVEDPQALVEQTLTLLRQQGFDAAELYPVCAEAARLFRAAEAGDNTAEAEAFCAAYARFAPGDNVLPGLALCGRAPICIGGLHLSREQLQLALENTGIPLLEARLRELACEPGECPSPELLNTLPQEEAAEPEAPLQAEPKAPLRAQTQETAPAPENAALRPAANDSPAEVPASPTEAPDSPTLASVRELAARADCAELLAAAKAVNAGELAVDDRERVLNLLHTTYLERTNTELEALVSDVESRSLPELLELQERINNGPYPVQKRTPYLERVTVWIERHQKEQLRAICAGIETATQRELEEITGQLSAEPCAEVLKQEFYDRIAERKTDLDREALDRVVEGAEQKSLKELQAISVTLQASNWNQELVTAYRHRIELLKEAAVFRELQEQLINLNDMERREVISLKDHVVRIGLAPRFVTCALAQIDRRLYRMDMLRLAALNNDFDRLDFEGLDTLRAKIMHSDVCPTARKIYLNRLMERENALVLETAAARGHLARQLAEKHKLRMSEFLFAAPSREYKEKLDAFWGGSGKEDARDYPAFLLTNGDAFALSGSRFYYKTDRGLEFLLLEEIQRFQYMKQKLTLNLQIVRKDNTYLLTEAKIGRSGADRTMSFLNECLLRWNEPGVENIRPVVPLTTARFDVSQFTQPVEPVFPNSEMALATLREQLKEKRLAEGLIPEGEEGRQKLGRILQAFELPERTPIVWYSVSTLLGSIREGTAFGPKAIYYKQSKQETRVLPLNVIDQIQATGSKQLTVTTLHNRSVVLNVPGALADFLRDYVAAIQLGNFLRQAEGDR